ncbi:MAG: Na+/H+ antiporter subunit C [Pirellulaceae bacterium]|nr:Na+/H+ antiporter subunit C [Pirellulaceae bacterium]
MELLLSSAIGVFSAAGVYLVLRPRTFSVVMGLSFLTYAINFFLVSAGRLSVNMPDILSKGKELSEYADPVPPALVLTSIVISFGMTAIMVVMGVRGYFENDSDHVNISLTEEMIARSRE